MINISTHKTISSVEVIDTAGNSYRFRNVLSATVDGKLVFIETKNSVHMHTLGTVKEVNIND